MLIQLKNFFIFWDKFYQDVFKVSLKKNWTTINFLKVLFYVSIWIVLLFLMIEYFAYVEFDLYTAWKGTLECVFLENKKCINEEYYPIPFDIVWLFCTDALDHMELINYVLVQNDNEFIYYFKFLSILVILFKNFINIWIILISFFVCIHLYFGLNNVYKDYIRDINITLQLFYLFISIFILIKLFVICFEYLYLEFQTEYYYRNLKMIQNIFFTKNISDMLVFNIVKISIIYIFIYLFINFLVNKNKIIFAINLNYIVYSSISFGIFVIVLYNIWVVYWSNDFSFIINCNYVWDQLMHFCTNYLRLELYFNLYGWVMYNEWSWIPKPSPLFFEIMHFFEYIINLSSVISKDACMLMHDIIFFICMFFYHTIIEDILLEFLYFIYDLLFS